MKFALDLWQVILLAGMIIGAFWTLAQILMAQAGKRLDEKFGEIRQQLAEQDANDRKQERQLAELRAELPREYVRREDFTRVIASFEVKVDNLRLSIERVIFGGANRN